MTWRTCVALWLGYAMAYPFTAGPAFWLDHYLESHYFKDSRTRAAAVYRPVFAVLKHTPAKEPLWNWVRFCGIRAGTGTLSYSLVPSRRAFSKIGQRMKLPRFILRELFLLVVIAAMGCGWWVEHRSIAPMQKRNQILEEWRKLGEDAGYRFIHVQTEDGRATGVFPPATP